ncbi:MAG: hypothetical protein JO127_11980 [Caulobacteraceae bacterium]|nr:hypothetical protein [Caulobacteraceae bacterium]
MKRNLLLVLALAAGLAGCETNGPAGPPVGATGGGEGFSDEAFAWSTRSGPDIIDGVLAYRGGPGQFSCQDVVLIPRTGWSRRRMIILYGSDEMAAVPVDDVRARTPSAPSGAYTQYVRHANCDAGNRFNFTGLPDGSWFVITVATPTNGGSKVAIMRRVETRGGVRRVTLG